MFNRKASLFLEGLVSMAIFWVVLLGIFSFVVPRIAEQEIAKAQLAVYEKINGRSFDEIKKMDCTDDFEVKVEADKNVYLTVYLNGSPVSFRAYDEDGQVKLTHANMDRGRHRGSSGITIFAPFPIHIP